MTGSGVVPIRPPILMSRSHFSRNWNHHMRTIVSVATACATTLLLIGAASAGTAPSEPRGTEAAPVAATPLLIGKQAKQRWQEHNEATLEHLRQVFVMRARYLADGSVRIDCKQHSEGHLLEQVGEEQEK